MYYHACISLQTISSTSHKSRSFAHSLQTSSLNPTTKSSTLKSCSLFFGIRFSVIWVSGFRCFGVELRGIRREAKLRFA